MLAGTIISLEEYLHTAYEPDAEFVDGEVVERFVGEYPHSKLQGLLYAYLLRRRRQWGITPIIEQRIRITPTRYRIPDICVVRGTEPTERVLTQPPWIWIEILSSEDRPLRVQRKVKEVLDFGVEYVWVIDPESLESLVYLRHAQLELPDSVFRPEGTGIAIPLRELEED